jgi:hypothetical protein
MDIQKGRAERIEEAIEEGYQSICKGYKEEYKQAVDAYKCPHKTLEDFEKAIGKVDKLVQEVHGVSDSCLNKVDIGLMVLYHGLLPRYEEMKIKQKRKEMKNWRLPFVEADVDEALKFIAEAKKRKSLNEEALDYYLGNGSC